MSQSNIIAELLEKLRNTDFRRPNWAVDFSEHETQIAAVVLAVSCGSIDGMLRGWKNVLTDDEDGEPCPDPAVVPTDRGTADRAIAGYREFDGMLTDSRLLCRIIPPRRIRRRVLTALYLARNELFQADAPAEMAILEGLFAEAVECCVSALKRCNRLCGRRFAHLEAELHAWADMADKQLPLEVETEIAAIATAKFDAPDCPECGKKTKVTSTRQRFRRLKCDKCGWTGKASKRST